ncbi:DNA mismatch repair protein [Echinicola sp. CAU 1574]|uniref:DNA mismatch repair protein n=1 Tax=Echinicola arenosa TaxID=2774144 RepID=A0ABR9AM30_9BACT|nr:DNA mismatch repair protein [Echinicola arenosa]MBD8488960.1 DNA mismatch repair protein [Echinicola arenosa]
MTVDFRTTNATEELRTCKQKMASLALSRLVLFFALGAVLIVGLTEIKWLLLLFFPLSALFIYFILLFNLQKDRQAFLKAVLQMEKDTVLRQNRELSSFDKGEVHKDKQHPFCNDLDLFGDHSLFQLIDHTVGEGGKALLADWMKAQVDPELAEKRFPAIRELSREKVFVRNFEAIGKAFMKEEKSKKAFYQWLKEPQAWKSFYFLPMVAGPSVGILLLFAWLFAGWSIAYISAWILLGLLALGMVFKPLLRASKVMPDEGDLKTLTAWARELEKLSFDDPYLKKLQSPVFEKSYKASVALKSLEQRSFMVQNRINMIYLIFNLLFWIDFIALFRLERWKQKHAGHMQAWETVFQEWQVLVSLAAFTNEEELDCRVDWTDSLSLEVENLKHPLLRHETCVGNDFKMEENQKTVLLTGSNMSGKTTFMRTLGINLVLVNLGLSPFAAKFVTGPFQLFTSMRNTDNLGESVSSFYAELARIKGLLDQAEKQLPIFFLLDEILKGTNTTDRVMGSEALIQQLAESHSKGIISTHDIELSELDNKIPTLVNYSFHSDIKDNEILFDYKIKKGPCPSFNAHKLMELMGIRFQY